MRSVNDIMPMIGARFYTQLDAAQMRNDVIEEDLAKVGAAGARVGTVRWAERAAPSPCPDAARGLLIPRFLGIRFLPFVHGFATAT